MHQEGHSKATRINQLRSVSETKKLNVKNVAFTIKKTAISPKRGIPNYQHHTVFSELYRLMVQRREHMF